MASTTTIWNPKGACSPTPGWWEAEADDEDSREDADRHLGETNERSRDRGWRRCSCASRWPGRADEWNDRCWAVRPWGCSAALAAALSERWTLPEAVRIRPVPPRSL